MPNSILIKEQLLYFVFFFKTEADVTVYVASQCAGEAAVGLLCLAEAVKLQIWNFNLLSGNASKEVDFLVNDLFSVRQQLKLQNDVLWDSKSKSLIK